MPDLLIQINMATEPLQNIIPTIQAPQTSYGVLQQDGMFTTTDGELPGERPMMPIHMARSIALGKFTLSSDDAIGTQYSVFAGSDDYYPTYNTEAWGVTGALEKAYRNDLAPAWAFYFCQSLYWNADITLTFWAIKPPAVVGRLRFTYRPPILDLGAVNDPAQREITEEWDLSASNLFEFKIPSYNLRQWRNTAINYAPLNGLASTYKTPLPDVKHGLVQIYNTHTYQPGSIFPTFCSIVCFMSFQNPQFATTVGPAIPLERTVLSYTNNPS